jgi:hypothetical protein
VVFALGRVASVLWLPRSPLARMRELPAEASDS